MYEGYSQEEPLVKNKSSDLPNFEEGATKNENKNDDFNFISENDNNNNKSENNQPSVQPTLNDFIMPSNNEKSNNNNFMNMDDFLSGNNNNNLEDLVLGVAVWSCQAGCKDSV